MIKKVTKVGIKKEKDYSYFVDDDGDISGLFQIWSGTGIPEKVAKIGLNKDINFFYFVDNEGDISCVRDEKGVIRYCSPKDGFWENYIKDLGIEKNVATFKLLMPVCKVLISRCPKCLRIYELHQRFCKKCSVRIKPYTNSDYRTRFNSRYSFVWSDSRSSGGFWGWVDGFFGQDFCYEAVTCLERIFCSRRINLFLKRIDQYMNMANELIVAYDGMPEEYYYRGVYDAFSLAKTYVEDFTHCNLRDAKYGLLSQGTLFSAVNVFYHSSRRVASNKNDVFSLSVDLDRPCDQRAEKAGDGYKSGLLRATWLFNELLDRQCSIFDKMIWND